LEIKLCYKSYPIALTPGGSKYYREKAAKIDGAPKSLTAALFTMYCAYLDSREKSIWHLCRDCFSSMDELVASYVFKAIITDKSIELEQIQDAMARVGWTPVEDDDSEFRQPWPIVMIDAFVKIENSMKDLVKEKK
jgi:hypothetical protein